MINCYVIVERENIEKLSANLLNYPLTRLVGCYNGSSLKLSEILGLSLQIIFVDYSLYPSVRHVIDRLSGQVSVVYLAKDQAGAYRAFEDGVLDYFTYPFDFDRFERCINKFIRFSLLSPSVPQFSKKLTVDSFFVKPDPKGKVELLINCNDILFIEAYQNDVAIQMADGRRFVSFHTMKEMEESLSSCFVRVHKSFIINYKKMSAFDGSNIIMETNCQFFIPLGGVYKKNFLEKRNTMVIRKTNRVIGNRLLQKALQYILTFCLSELNLVHEILCI